MPAPTKAIKTDSIFASFDRDGSGSICASELRQALRSSGAIKSMYDGSLRTFGTLIAATLAFGLVFLVLTLVFFGREIAKRE